MKSINIVNNLLIDQTEVWNKLSSYSIDNAKYAIRSGQAKPGIVGGRDSLKVVSVTPNPDKTLNVTINTGYALSQQSLEEVSVDTSYNSNTDLAYSGSSGEYYIGIRIYKEQSDPRTVYGSNTAHNITRFNSYELTLNQSKLPDNDLEGNYYIWLAKVTIEADAIATTEDVREFSVGAGFSSDLFETKEIAKSNNPLAMDYNVFLPQEADITGNFWDMGSSFSYNPFSGYKKTSGVYNYVSQNPVEGIHSLEVTNKVGDSRRSEVRHQISVPSEASEEISATDVFFAYSNGFKLYTNANFVDDADEKKRLYPDKSKKASLDFSENSTMVRHVGSSDIYGEFGFVRNQNTETFVLGFSSTEGLKTVNFVTNPDMENGTIELKLPKSGGIIATQAAVLASQGFVSYDNEDPAGYLIDKIVAASGGGIDINTETYTQSGGGDATRIVLSLASTSYFSELNIGPNSGNTSKLTSKDTGKSLLALADATGGFIVGQVNNSDISQYETKLVSRTTTDKNLVFHLPLTTAQDLDTYAVWTEADVMKMRMNAGVVGINLNSHEGKTFTISANGTEIATTADIASASSSTVSSTYTIHSGGSATLKTIIQANDGFVSIYKDSNVVANLTRLRIKELELGANKGLLSVLSGDHIQLSASGATNIHFEANELYKGAQSDNNKILSAGELNPYLNDSYLRKGDYEYQSDDMINYILGSSDKEFVEVGQYAQVSDYGVFVDGATTPTPNEATGGFREYVTNPQGQSIYDKGNGPLYWNMNKFIGTDRWRPYITIKLRTPVRKIHSITMAGIKYDSNVIGLNPARVEIHASINDGSTFSKLTWAHSNADEGRGVWKDTSGKTSGGFITHVRIRVEHIPNGPISSYLTGADGSTNWSFNNISIVGSEAQYARGLHIDGFEYVSKTGVVKTNQSLNIEKDNDNKSALQFNTHSNNDYLDLGTDFDYVRSMKSFQITDGGTVLSFSGGYLHSSTGIDVNGTLRSDRVQIMNGNSAYDALVRNSNTLEIGNGFSSGITLKKNTVFDGTATISGALTINSGSNVTANGTYVTRTTAASDLYFQAQYNGTEVFKIGKANSLTYIDSDYNYEFRIGDTKYFGITPSEVSFNTAVDVTSLQVTNKSALQASSSNLLIGSGFSNMSIRGTLDINGGVRQSNLTNNNLRLTHTHGTLDLGVTSNGRYDISTSEAYFYMNKELRVGGNGYIGSNGSDLYLSRNGQAKVAIQTNGMNLASGNNLYLEGYETLRKNGTTLVLGSAFSNGVALNNRYLSDVRNPTTDNHVGDRGYNDARYAPIDTPYMELWRTTDTTASSTSAALCTFTSSKASTGMYTLASRGALRIPPYSSWLVSFSLNFGLDGGGSGMYVYMTAHTSMYTSWVSSANRYYKTYIVLDPSDGESGKREEFLASRTFLYHNTSSSFRYLQCHYQMAGSGSGNQLRTDSVFSAVQIAG